MFPQRRQDIHWCYKLKSNSCCNTDKEKGLELLIVWKSDSVNRNKMVVFTQQCGQLLLVDEKGRESAVIIKGGRVTSEQDRKPYTF